jgi:hypothetical protein
MTNTPSEYRDYAIGCLKWANDTPNPKQRKTFVDLARLWMDAAYHLDRGVAVPLEQSEKFLELREKLN